MDKRFVTFLVLTFAVLAGNMMLMRWLQPPQAPKAPVAAADAQEKPGEKPAAEAAVAAPQQPQAEGDKVAGEGAAGEGAAVAADPVVAPAPEVPEQRFTLGSIDPASGYRMAVYFVNTGAAVERLELNSPNYLDQEDRSGYLGHLDATMPPNNEAGALVRVVAPGTPAARAGLQVDDIIVGLNGQDIIDEIQFLQRIEQTEPGDDFTLSVKRAGQTVSLTGKLARRPMQVLRPEFGPTGRDPLSFLLTLNSIDDRRIPDGDDELPGLHMRTANWQALPQTDPDELAFQYDLPGQGLAVIKKFRLAKVDDANIDDPLAPAYHLSFAVEVRNTGNAPHKVAWRLEGPTGLPLEGAWYATKISPRWFRSAGMRDVVAGLFPNNRAKYALVSASSIADDKDITPWQDVPLTYIGVDAQYFAVALLPHEEDAQGIPYARAIPLRVGDVPEDRAKLNRTNVSFRLVSKAETIAPGGTPFAQSFKIFSGPKKPSLLSQYGLGKLLYYGWFGFVAEPMSIVLHLFHRLVPNYGIAIIMLTVLVRSLMYPISRRQALNAQKMQELQPELKRLQEKYKTNMEARSKAQQELFRKHNYNPLSGCLPLFLQLPIFMGLYRSLAVDVELRGAPLISESVRWCSNLAAPDMLWDWQAYLPTFLAGTSGFLGPYFNLLPCITSGLFIWQQRMFMPPPADEQAAVQQKVMQYMTIMIGLMFFKVPSGLCVYFIASSLWGISERKLLPKPTPPGGTVPPTNPRPAANRPAPNGNGSQGNKKKNRGRA